MVVESHVDIHCIPCENSLFEAKASTSSAARFHASDSAPSLDAEHLGEYVSSFMSHVCPLPNIFLKKTQVQQTGNEASMKRLTIRSENLSSESEKGFSSLQLSPFDYKKVSSIQEESVGAGAEIPTRRTDASSLRVADHREAGRLSFRQSSASSHDRQSRAM